MNFNSIAKRLLGVVLAGVLFNTSVAAEFTLPEYDRYQLDNGLTVYLMQQDEVPLISAQVVLRSGSLADGDKAGLASFTANGLMFGNDKMTKQEIESAFEFQGAELSSGSAFDYSQVAMKSSSEDFEKLFEVMTRGILSPSFDATETDKYRDLLVQRLTQAKESPRAVINNYFNRELYGDEGYGRPATGTIESAKSIERGDLVEFHKSHYVPSNAAVVVVGDFKSRAMKKLIRSTLGGWEGDAIAVAQGSAAKPLDTDRVLLVDKADARESTFVIGGPGIERSNPDFVALSVINTILGGRFTSWLNDELRVNSGLTYGARSRFSPYKDSGTFAISTFTQTKTTKETIDLALKTYAKLWEQGIDQATLTSAKNYVNGLYPPRYETNSQLAGLLGEMFIFGFDESFINTFSQSVNELDVERANELISKYFPRENMQFVIVGQAEAIKDIADDYGTMTVESIND